tara:strand:- start:3529 stop:4083 length:555 start_codon:yes stop_codon:yes gene_type:complete
MPPTLQISTKSTYVMGVDFAHMGADNTAFIILEKPFTEDTIYVVHIEETSHKLLTDAISRIQYLDKKFNFRKIYMDYTGLGTGVVDVLRERILSHKIAPIRFTVQSKEDMYSNLKVLFETKRLKIPKHKKLIAQLMDLRYELMSSKHIKIHHSDKGHDDLTDALALAALYFKPKRKGTFTVIGV